MNFHLTGVFRRTRIRLQILNLSSERDKWIPGRLVRETLYQQGSLVESEKIYGSEAKYSRLR